MHAGVLAPLQLCRLSQGAERPAVLARQREFELIAGQRHAQKLHQPQHHPDFVFVRGERQEALPVGAVIAGQVKPGVHARPEQNRDGIHDRPAAVHLDGQIESALMRG